MQKLGRQLALLALALLRLSGELLTSDEAVELALELLRLDRVAELDRRAEVVEHVHVLGQQIADVYGHLLRDQ